MEQCGTFQKPIIPALAQTTVNQNGACGQSDVTRHQWASWSYHCIDRYGDILLRHNCQKCWLIIGEFYLDCPDKSHAWCLHLNIYNTINFICYIPEVKQEFQATFLQLTAYPNSIDVQTYFYGTYPSMWQWFQNKSPARILTVDLDICISAELRMFFRWGLANRLIRI